MVSTGAKAPKSTQPRVLGDNPSYINRVPLGSSSIMLNSTSSMPGQSQSPMTPVQGRDELNYGSKHQIETTSAAVTPVSNPSRIATPAKLAALEATPKSTSPGLTDTPVSAQNLHLNAIVESNSPTKQSFLHQALSNKESPTSSPSSTPGSSWSTAFSPRDFPQRPVMSFTGDKTAPDGNNSFTRISTWYLRRARPQMDELGEGQSIPTDATPTKPCSSNPTNTQSPISPSKPKALPSSATSSRFSFFSSSKTAPKAKPKPSAATPLEDELFNLDIETALYPRGSPIEGEAFSPAAFKNLHMTATGMLKKYQNAYQQRAIAYEELKMENTVQIEEKHEAETRTQHLRMQLEGMAQKASETEAVMQALMEELKREKSLRLAEQLARGRASEVSEGSTVSEDLGAEYDQRRRDWRKSGGTAKSNFSVDTDEESIEEASLFSRSRSPTIAASVCDSISPIDSLHTLPPTQPTKPVMLEPPGAARQSQPQMTAFQKLFKGSSAQTIDECMNCHGQDASMAWDTAGLLRDENRGLKQRVEELETAVENALDVVNSVGL